MSRELNPAELQAVTAPVVMPFFAVEMDYPDGMVRATTLDRPITLPSEATGEPAVFAGVGVLGEIGDVESGSENRSYGLSVSLSGIPMELRQYLLEQDAHGRPVWVGLGFVSPAYGVLLYRVIARLNNDAPDLQVGEQLAVVVNCESAAVDWERARVRRCTDADHRARHPNDGFFKYVAAMENMNLAWGRG
jgi:hypothetical protein